MKRTLYYLDSGINFSPDYNSRVNYFFKNWNLFVSFRKNLKKDKNDTWNLVKFDTHIQTETYNCGVYVCFFFHLLINNNENSINNPVDNISQFRNFIKETILKNSSNF